MYQQCVLVCGKTHLVCLLPLGKVKAGNLVTLKDDVDPERRWIVFSVGLPVSEAFVHRTWNNNI